MRREIDKRRGQRVFRGFTGPHHILAGRVASLGGVKGQLDECVLCYLCTEACPAGSMRIIKKYEQ